MTGFRSGNGAAWLDLLATLGGRYHGRRVERLDSPARLRAWLREHALEPTGGLTATDLEQARNLREALHRTAAAAVRDAPPAGTDLRLINSALAADRPLRLASREVTVARPGSTAEALARLARDAVQDLGGPNRVHLHACGDDTCAGIFLDTTGRRRWCSDQSCGNRMRVRAHRSRARQA